MDFSVMGWWQRRYERSRERWGEKRERNGEKSPEEEKKEAHLFGL
jgi:hypothetical protein